MQTHEGPIAADANTLILLPLSGAYHMTEDADGFVSVENDPNRKSRVQREVLRSDRLDARKPDGLSAHFSVSSAMNSFSLNWRTNWVHIATEVGKPRLDFGIDESGIDFAVEPLDDFGGRILRRADAEPSASFEARQMIFTDGRNIRQRLRPRQTRHSASAQLVGPDVLDCGGGWGES